MITYAFTARNLTTGEEIKAEVQAESEQAAAKLLISQNFFPIHITAKKEGGGLLSNLHIGKKVKTKERVIFSRQLSTLINAGLPVAQSLRTVRNQISSEYFRGVVDKIIADIEGGSSLAAAFGEHPEAFNQTYVSLVAAGEVSGSLDANLERIANQQEKDAAIVSKVRGAMIYPLIVLAVVVAVVIFMLVAVIPQIALVYHDLDRQLPILTRLLLSISNFIKHFWFLWGPVLVLVALGIRNYFKTERGRRMADDIKLKAPIFGNLFQKLYMARFSRTLGTLLSSGIPVLEALETVKGAINNVLVAEQIDEIITDTRGGKALSDSIEKQSTFTDLVPQMVRVGEQAGAIDDMLAKVAQFYEDEVDNEIKNLSVTIEPALMVIMGVIVGGIIIAVLFPVYNLVGQGVKLK